MLPTPAMLAIKNRAVFVAALALLLGGCTPPGPRALLDGKRLLERGNYAKAVERLKEATSLMSSNAQAWNYLGLAQHHAGQPVEAEKAYRRALLQNHDLSEAHYNLGCLLLEQNKAEAAERELMAFTLRRANSVDGLAKLGTAQLRSREYPLAEKSFRDVLRLDARNAEALNGLGLIRALRGKAGEASQFFEQALRCQSNYPPALLNLGLLCEQQLHQPQAALQRYRQYLALKPTPADAESVRALAGKLEQAVGVPHAQAATLASVPPNAPPTAKPSGTTNAVKAGIPPKAEAPVLTNRLAPVPRKAAATAAVAAASTPALTGSAGNEKRPAELEVVTVPDGPVIRPGQEVALAGGGGVKSASPPAIATAPVGPASPRHNQSAQIPAPGSPPRKSFLQKINPMNLLRSDGKPPSAQGAGSNSTGILPAQEGAKWARYNYRPPAARSPGNRAEAERSFAQGAQAQRAGKLLEAVQSYRRAAQTDPTFFEAFYNLGVVAWEADNLKLALSAYEDALSLRPDSLDARYNFALALKQANCIPDAVKELERIVARFPNDSRAHLALGNLYSQQLGQPAKARSHYLKVLEADPRHPQAGAIRYWLAENPGS